MGKEKKEIGMEKLIELLNEREIGEEGGELYYLSNGIIRDDGGNILYDYRIISKQFGFIKWLVENDKINRHGIPEFYPVSDHCLECVYEGIEDNTIMLLSIQKNPIDFLCSLLK